jgi:hypothetical protein
VSGPIGGRHVPQANVKQAWTQELDQRLLVRREMSFQHRLVHVFLKLEFAPYHVD